MSEDLARYFPEHFGLLSQEDVVEVSLNPCGTVFVERFGLGTRAEGKMEPSAAERFIRYCAAQTEQSVTKNAPILSARIPSTPHRLEALLPPVVAAPSFSIRRHRGQVVDLAEFAGSLELADQIAELIAARKNIVVAGATGSGKTTFLNSCLATLAKQSPHARLLVLEDTPEIVTQSENALSLLSNADVSLERLLVSSLRLSPERVIVGEVRTGAVLMTLLKSWNTGHPGGFTTVHADGARDVVARFEMLASEVSVSDQTSFIHRAVDAVIFLERGVSAPVISELLSIHTSGQQETLYAR